MEIRQKVILVLLVCLSLLQQGIRWQAGNRGLPIPLESVGIVSAQASSSPLEEGDSHCDLVHVNTVGMAELQTLPGIGPVYAERIILARQEEPFLETKDLLRVSGIGQKRLAQIADLICLFFEVNDGEK